MTPIKNHEGKLVVRTNCDEATPFLPGGRVVAVMSPAWHLNSTKKFVSFRQWFDGLSANGMAEVAEELESGTFSKSGTDVATEIVILRKPLSK